MTEKHLKETFVSNLNGTTVTEITLGLSISPLCFLCRSLVFVLYQQRHGMLFNSWKFHLLLDFLLLVTPLILSCTLFSDFLYVVPLVCIAFSALLVYIIYTQRTSYKNVKLLNICKSFLKAQTENETVPAVTTLRVFLNMLTAVCILAVDFPAFPRRYAKTEIYGTGVMDLGVGGFIFANAIVSPEAKAKEGLLHNGFSRLKKQIISALPLVVLGFGRIISLKAADYQEHVSEYGVHWNFFFTLAVVKVLASVILTAFPAEKAWITATVFVSLYQMLLETADLRGFVFNGSDGKGSRVGFLNANREGIVSTIGYTAIYMSGVQVGLYVLKKRVYLMDWVISIWNLIIMSFSLFGIFHIFQVYVEPASRRLANVTFFIWIIAEHLLFLCLTLICDLIVTFSKYLVSGSSVPGTWVISNSYSSKNHGMGKKGMHCCLIAAVSRNQLLFFLLSNIMTGVVNMVMDTLHSNVTLTLSVLLMYMLCNCLIVYILNINNITIKWW